MFCSVCGTKLDDNAQFCPNCGSPTGVNAKTNEDNNEPMSSNTSSSDGNNSNNKQRNTLGRKLRKLLFRVLLILILVVSVLLVLDYFDIIDEAMVNSIVSTLGSGDRNGNGTGLEPEETSESTRVEIERPDADEYYHSISDSVTEIPVMESGDVFSENNIKDILVNRGFDTYDITYEYSLDGEYCGENVIDETSNEKHPTYHTYYVTSSNELWTIMVVNGSVTAYPVSYNMQSEREAEVHVTETETITCYDSVTDKFYELKPYESEAIIVLVDQVDAETLEGLSIEGINELCER